MTIATFPVAYKSFYYNSDLNAQDASMGLERHELLLNFSEFLSTRAVNRRYYPALAEHHSGVAALGKAFQTLQDMSLLLQHLTRFFKCFRMCQSVA